MKNTMEYKGYIGSVEFSEGDGIFFGKVMGIRSLKVKSDRDSTGVRKISLIENLSANMSYNMADRKSVV